MKRSFAALLFVLCFIAGSPLAQTPMPDNSIDIVRISQQLLLAAKRHEATDSFTILLSRISDATLSAQLPDDNHKKAFWINLYNAYTQLLLSKDPGMYRKRSSFFGNRMIQIAGRQMSLDDIEHGILRRSKIKWSMGYAGKWFPGAFEKKHRVDMLDPRIHFSLNCGAKSCPPIAFYRPEQLDRQLDMATKTYLKNETDYRVAGNRIYLPAIMGWFRGDFGGKKKMKELLQEIHVLSPGQDPSIAFSKYDWNLFLENYKTD